MKNHRLTAYGVLIFLFLLSCYANTAISQEIVLEVRIKNVTSDPQGGNEFLSNILKNENVGISLIPNEASNQNESKLFSNSIANDSYIELSREIQHIKTNLMKYRQTKLTGIWLTVGGGFLYGLSLGMFQTDLLDEQNSAILLITGGLMAASGYIVILASNSHLKKAYLGPTKHGVGVGINF